MRHRTSIAKRIMTTLSAAIVLLFGAALLTKCASTMTPTGGPKDTLPPVIVLMQPDNFTTNIDTLHPPKIYVEFNEYVQIKDQQKELYTSPAMKKKPSVVRRGRGIVVTIKDTLRPNTTYAINFGSSIQDNNESNPLHSMRYVFSTGDEIDSMYMSGYTADSYKADSVSKSFIYFFIADSVEKPTEWDSTMFKYKPHVIARAEKNGIFIAQNLKPVDYRIYAFEDTNNNMEYEPSVDQIGFLDSTYNPLTMPGFSIWFDSLRHYPSADPQLYFRMFMDKKFARHTLSGQERVNRHKAILYFGAPNPDVKEILFDSIPSDRVIYDPQTVGKDTVALWFDMAPEELPDTIKGTIRYLKHDSINNLVESTDKLRLAWVKVETKEEREERERLEKEREKAAKAGTEWVEPEVPNPFKITIPSSGDFHKDKHVDIEFDFPLTKFDSAAITLKMTTEQITEPQDVEFHFIQDSINRCKFQLRADWQPLAKYELLMPAGVFENVAHEQNDTIKCSYTGSDPAKFAKVNINLKSSKDQARYILQLTNAQGKTQKQIRNATTGSYTMEYVTPGDVMLRVVEDLNGNGKWDSGDMVAMRQPERTEIYKNEEGLETIATKENWEFDIEVDMDKLFAPITMETVVKMLNDREDERLKKLAEEMAKKRKENANKNNNQGQSSGMGFGGMGGMGGLGGSSSGMGGFGGTSGGRSTGGLNGNQSFGR
ncbi:MAG: Ig-like domain-containing protein [Alistipes sp.]|nr:Ig-like domain-containing protein [Alistipes sp.]